MRSFITIPFLLFSPRRHKAARDRLRLPELLQSRAHGLGLTRSTFLHRRDRAFQVGLHLP